MKKKCLIFFQALISATQPHGGFGPLVLEKASLSVCHDDMNVAEPT